MQPVWKKAMGIFGAMNCVGCSVALFLLSDLGCDPIGILCDGISRTLGIPYGNASLLYNAVMILLALMYARHDLGAGTLVYAIFSGYFIDFYQWIFCGLHLGNTGLITRVFLCLTGEVLLSLGLAALIRFRLGMNALDALLCKIEKITRISYSSLRTGADITYAITGILLGGIFGIGTVLSMLMTGKLVSKLATVQQQTGSI